MSTSPAPVPIVIWVHPRSCSTAFERSLMQRPDTLVFHEPIGDPFYYGGTDRACKRFSDEQGKASGHWDSTVAKVLETMVHPSQEDVASNKTWPPKFVFIKDMGQCLIDPELLHQLHPDSKVFPASAKSTGKKFDLSAPVLENPTVVPTAILKRFKHSFLIRTPERSIPSYFKCVEEGASGWTYWDDADAGYKELKILYDWFSNPQSSFNQEAGDEFAVQQPQPPPLLDASTLLAHPNHSIKQYCNAVGIPFAEEMLSWDSGPVNEWAKWGGYHNAAEKSTGFIKETKAKVPEHLQAIVENNMPAYNYLLAKTTIRAPESS